MAELPRGRQYTYYNVHTGLKRVVDGVEHVTGGYSGRITGVRTRISEYNGTYTEKLELRLLDVDTGEEVIVSGTLFVLSADQSPRSTTVWARMFLERVLNPANGVEPDVDFEFGWYGFEKATCFALRRPGQEQSLPGGGKLDPNDFARIRRGVQALIDKFGTFGKGVEEKGHKGWDGATQDPYPWDQEAPPPTEKDDLPF